MVLAMQFIAPTIGNVYCYHDDLCCGVFCSGLVGHCERPWTGLPRGKLVLIAPKTIFYKIIRIIGFAYSPANYSQEEIDSIKQRYLQKLSLREDEAHIVEFDIVMNEKGYPRIPIYIDRCNSENNRYFKGANLFIDPDGLTVWNMTYLVENLQQSSHTITIEFVHDDPGLMEYIKNSPDLTNSCGFLCEHVDGNISIEVQDNLSKFELLLLILLISLIFYLARKEIQKKRNNFQSTKEERPMKFDSYGFSGSFSLGAVIGSILGLGLILSGTRSGFSALGIAIVTSAVIGLAIYAIDATLVSIVTKITGTSDDKASSEESLAREPTNFMNTILEKKLHNPASFR
jgi:hypothetical protein